MSVFNDSAVARTMLRCGLATAIAVLAALKSSLGGGIDGEEWVDIVSAGVGAIAVYLGIGALVPQVEPFFGNKLEPTQVPAPPAVPDPDK